MKSISLIIYFIFTILIIQVKTTKKWLHEVSGFNKDGNNGFVGIYGKAITGLRISGEKEYRVHIKGGDWLSPVTGNDIKDDVNGYAGTLDGNEIDAVTISGGDQYAVHIKGRDWLLPVTGYDINQANKGYAGIIGSVIDAIMINGRTYATSYNTISPNQYDPPESKATRAIEIYNFFTSRGWSITSICGLLGNIEVETANTFNPNYQGYNNGDTYGLLQWNPESTLKNWATKNGLNYNTIYAQCRRIQYEYENAIQFSPSSYCSYSFSQYVKSYASPGNLAQCFAYNYKKLNPRFANVEGRMKKAQQWCTFF